MNKTSCGRSVYGGTGICIAFSLPLILLFFRPNELIGSSMLLIFHNMVELFSIVVCLSIFGVGWFTFDQTKDRHALFLSAVFLSLGLLDCMHTFAHSGMPDLITHNSSEKSLQFRIAFDISSALAFLVSAFIKPGSRTRWLSKNRLIGPALLIPGLLFIGITFFSPIVFREQSGYILLKRTSEYMSMGLLGIAAVLYRKRKPLTGKKELTLHVTAFIAFIASKGLFSLSDIDFDGFAIAGHVYQFLGFLLIYDALFAVSIKRPYAKLTHLNRNLQNEIVKRKKIEAMLERVPPLLIAAQDEERRKIGVELHDSIGQTLAAVKYYIETVLSEHDMNSGPALKNLGHCVPTLQRAIEETRTMYMGLGPTIIEELGINATLQWFCREFQVNHPSHHLELETTVEEEDVPSWIKTPIFRIAQDSLDNVARHSHAEWVDVILAKKGNAIELIIADDGKGFDPNTTFSDPDRRGLGLIGIRERAKLAGGRMSIMSVPGEGTTVRVSWPFKSVRILHPNYVSSS